MKVEKGQVWSSNSHSRSKRVFVVIRTDETYAYTLALTDVNGTPIESYLQSTSRVALKNLNPKYGYKLREENE